MSDIAGGHLVARYLREVENIGVVFTLCGGHTESILDGLRRYQVRVVDVRHEQAGTMMAAAWSIYTGRPGVCVVTAGPGFMNSLTGVAVAHYDNIPLVLIAGRHAVREDLTGERQEMTQIDIVRPLVKWAATCYDARRIPEYLATAFAYAIEGRPGPVFLDIPKNVSGAEVPEESAPMPASSSPRSRFHPDDPDLLRAAEIINSARKPFLIGGSGVSFSDCGDCLRHFVEKTGMPFELVNYGRGAIPDQHPLSLVEGGFTSINLALSNADVIVAAGIRFNWLFQSGRAISADAKIIKIDIDPTEINRNRAAAAGLVGDVGSVLGQLVPLVQQKDHGEWIGTLRSATRSFGETELRLRDKPSDPIHPARLVEQVRKAVNDKALYVCDGGDTSYWGFTGFRTSQRAGVVAGSGGLLGCIGTGIPFSIAAKLIHPEQTVVLLTGDGSFGFNAMEFDTAVRHGIPFLCIVNNDCSWGMVKHTQEMSLGKGRQTCVDFPVVHYEKMVEALGGYGEFVTRDEEIAPAVLRALESGKPACINVLTDPSVASPASLAIHALAPVE